MIRLPTKQACVLFSRQMDAVLQTSSSKTEKIDKLRQLAIKEAPYHGNSFARSIASILIHYPEVELDTIRACLTKAFEKRTENAHSQKDSRSFSPFSTSSDLIRVVHGGGLEHIQDFLEGKSEGHAFEAGGKGIFISPKSSPLSDRASSYALRTPLQFFQTPCVMEAIIPGNKLVVVNDNSYEAVIPPESISAITSVTYTIFNPKDREIFRVLSRQNMPTGGRLKKENGLLKVDYTNVIKEYITDDPEIVEKIATTLSKIVSENF